MQVQVRGHPDRHTQHHPRPILLESLLRPQSPQREQQVRLDHLHTLVTSGWDLKGESFRVRRQELMRFRSLGEVPGGYRADPRRQEFVDGE
jgi:hypothetical protein